MNQATYLCYFAPKAHFVLLILDFSEGFALFSRPPAGESNYS